MGSLATARTTDGGHGRSEVRPLHARAGLAGWSAWPGLGQVCRLVHQTKRQGRWQIEVHYKITSLPPEQADATDLLRLSRGHWAVENQLHYIRDVTLGEDARRIRSGAAPQAMAAVRNLVLAVLHRVGTHTRASGIRHFGWQPDRAATALGLSVPQPIAASRAA